MRDGTDSAATVDAVERAFSVIRALRELDGAGVTELSKRLDMSKSGVHKQLTTLVEEGYVTKARDEYRLSFKFIADGEYVKNNSSFYAVGAPETDDLANESGDFAHLVAMERKDAYCVYVAKGDNAVATDVNVGDWISLHSSAAGKAILSELPDEYRERVIKQELLPKTEFTITDETELAQELDEIQANGVAFEDQENVRGMRSVGAPILSSDGDVLGAVAVSGPLSLLTDDRFRNDLPGLVRQTKNFIEVKVLLESRESIEEGSHVPKDFY